MEEIVTLGIAGMLRPIFLVIAWMSSMPLNLAVTLVGPVVRINRELVLLPFPFASALTGLLTAIALILYPRIGIKGAPTMGSYALNFCVHGFPPPGEKP
jgi:hypothetical protein